MKLLQEAKRNFKLVKNSKVAPPQIKAMPKKNSQLFVDSKLEEELKAEFETSVRKSIVPPPPPASAPAPNAPSAASVASKPPQWPAGAGSAPTSTSTVFSAAASLKLDASVPNSLAQSDLIFGAEGDEDETLDAKTRGEKHAFAKNVHTSFRPVIYLLEVLGRWPLSTALKKDGTREYSWNWRRPGAAYFIFVTTLVIYVLLFGSWGMISILTSSEDGDKKNEVQYERVIFERHLVTFVVLWTSLIHCAVASLAFVFRRKYVAFYFTFWSRALPTMHMDAAKGTFRSMMFLVLSYSSVMLSLVILSIASLGPTSRGAPTLLGILMFRHYLPSLYELKKEVVSAHSPSSTPTPTTSTTSSLTLATDNVANLLASIATTMAAPSEVGPTTPPSLAYKYSFDETNASARKAITIIGGFVLILLFAASKSYMLVFIYKCKLLKNAFGQWNGRVYASVLKGPLEGQSHAARTTFTLLFRDHCVLLDLLEGTDQLFATVLESYFALQVCSICFEAYFFIRTARFGDDRINGLKDGYFTRPYDWLPAMIIFFQSIVLLLMVCYSAAGVGEEAMAGMEVLRRRSLLARKTNDELYFMITMFASYTAYKRLELTGGGYFYLNKDFFVGVVSTILSYFIILYQFQPKLDHFPLQDDQKINGFQRRKAQGDFLAKLEDFGPADHWNTPGPK